jgi:hypothetical protein
VIKHYSEYNRDDVHRLLTLGKLDEISKVIAAIDIGTTTGHADFLTYLASLI